MQALPILQMGSCMLNARSATAVRGKPFPFDPLLYPRNHSYLSKPKYFTNSRDLLPVYFLTPHLKDLSAISNSLTEANTTAATLK